MTATLICVLSFQKTKVQVGRNIKSNYSITEKFPLHIGSLNDTH